MLNKLVKLGALFAAVCTTAYAEEAVEKIEEVETKDQADPVPEPVPIRLIEAGENPAELTQKFAFSVISFYKPSDPKSVQVHEYF